METFSTLLALCEGNSPVISEVPTQRPVKRSLDVFFDLRLNKRLSKHLWGRWFETPSCSLWYHCNVSFSPAVHEAGLGYFQSIYWYVGDNVRNTSWWSPSFPPIDLGSHWEWCGHHTKEYRYDVMTQSYKVLHTVQSVVNYNTIWCNLMHASHNSVHYKRQ